MIVSEAIEKFDTQILDHLDRQVTVPVVTTAGCQGDVSILKVTTPDAGTRVTRAGVAVVAGENGGNTHSLHAVGDVFYDRAANAIRSLVLGTLTVGDGSEAVMAHPEHGFLLIAAGTYRIGRQREFAGEWRMVAD